LLQIASHVEQDHGSPGLWSICMWMFIERR
jgi:hypothetical protein